MWVCFCLPPWLQALCLLPVWSSWLSLGSECEVERDEGGFWWWACPARGRVGEEAGGDVGEAPLPPPPPPPPSFLDEDVMAIGDLEVLVVVRC